MMKMDKLKNCESGSNVIVRGRVHNLRVGKKMSFLILRDMDKTLQCVASSESYKDILNKLRMESIVEITGKLIIMDKNSVKGCNIDNMEIILDNVKIISEPITETLPLQIHNVESIKSHMDTNLNHRTLSLRTIENQSIFKIQSLICTYFREYMKNNGFIEIHTPKIISVASESGAQVFPLKYFDTTRYLAQSPQLYKQMMINSDYDRVYEIGPVFRAEKSVGPRHLTEFTGLDMEMTIFNDCREVIEMLYGFLKYCFDNIKNKDYNLLKNIPTFKDIKYPDVPLILDYYECIDELEKWGYNVQSKDDINTADEKEIGKMVKEKYDSDIVVLINYPKNARPFYSMPHESNENVCKSYDFILCGNEILSGAQRINSYEMLVNNAKKHNINIDNMKEYFDSFKYGSPCHGGGGFGLERITMFFLGLPNIKNASLYPNFYNN